MTAHQQPDEPTRDEIREACEAVPGWEWEEDDGVSGWCVWSASNPDNELRWPRFIQGAWEAWDGDAHAMLEATGKEFRVHRYREGGKWWYAATVGDHWRRDEPTLRAAAVRAVLAWARSQR